MLSEEHAFLASGIKGVGMGKCGPASLLGEGMANACLN